MGFPESYQNFFGVLESYNQDAGTFFTPIGDMLYVSTCHDICYTYHDMRSVSGLPYREFPYEEHFARSIVIGEMDKLRSESMNMYLEVLCHLNICMDMHERHKGRLSFTKWVRYLDLRTPKKLKHVPLSEVVARVGKQ